MVHREPPILGAFRQVARCIAGLALCLLFGWAGPTGGQSGGDIALERIKRATVFIYQAKGEADDLVVTCVSSGTIISADGRIVSKAHGIAPDSLCDGDTLIVALNVDLDAPPIPKYRAEIISAAPGLDVALLQISRELDGRLIGAANFPALPFVSIGDSDAVAIDDNLLFVGFPSLGEEPARATRGTVTALIAEPVGGARAWFKTRAAIPGAMAGGGAYNTAGELVGIPTNAPLSGFGAGADCRFIADSNKDGLVNNSDRCVPIGDFISTIRPIAAASSMIRGAQLGLSADTSPELRLNPPRNPPRASRLFFAPSARGDMPTTVVGALPANSRSLYLFFDYDNMTAETVYELRVARDGAPDTIFSLPPARWSGRERGLWHIGGREQAWANGAYEFDLLINGANAGSQRIVIGGAARQTGRFSDIVVGRLDRNGALVGNGLVVPAVDIASARFLYANMRDGADWSAIWYFDDAEVARTSDAWSDGAHGAKSISLAPATGLLPGRYRLELYLEDALSATTDFVVAGQPGSPLPVVFDNLRFVSADNPIDARSAPPASTFPGGIPALRALFDWRRIAAGTPWEARLLVDGDIFYRAAGPWPSVESGADFAVTVPNPPDGAYRLELLVNNLKLAEIDAIVGIGQLPIDRFAEAEGAILAGRVVDSATNLGIPGVTIVLIGEEFAAAEFEWRQDQVFDLARSDRGGAFQFGRPLAFETPYSIVIEADGYLPLAADGFEFNASQPLREMVIELARG